MYVIAQLKFKDRPRYDRYKSPFIDVLQFERRLLAADEHPIVLEGAWDRDKIVMMSFPSGSSTCGLFDLPVNREIAGERVASAEAIALFLQGLG